MRLEIGPYPLDWGIIDQAIIRRSPGVIVLGEMAANRRTFRATAVTSVARDLKRTLFGLVEEGRRGWFWCAYAAFAADADAWAHALSEDLLDERQDVARWQGPSPAAHVTTRTAWRRSAGIGPRR